MGKESVSLIPNCNSELNGTNIMSESQKKNCDGWNYIIEIRIVSLLRGRAPPYMRENKIAAKGSYDDTDTTYCFKRNGLC